MKRITFLILSACLCASAQDIKLEKLGSFTTGVFDKGASEIVAYDVRTQRLFTVNGDSKSVDILDIKDPAKPVLFRRVTIPERYGSSANSVAIKNGMIAVACEAANRQQPGSVIFLDANGRVLNGVTVGPVPDMLTFTPDGRKVLVANEGEPSPNYATDPEGSVSIIDVSKGTDALTQTDVKTADFKQFNPSNLPAGIRVYGPRATPAQAFEPEYIAVSDDGKTAYVTLQEANAIAVLDVEAAQFTRLMPLGYKNHNVAGNGLDASDRDNAINIKNWPVLGMYEPDAIAFIRRADKTYVVTANEGDTRDYPPAYSEEARVSAVKLDPAMFPNAADLQKPENLGRLTISTANADFDGDGDLDRLYLPGGRSFSIWSTDGSQVFDSGDQFEQITAKDFPKDFNSDAAGGLDTRSDNKGVEPEGVAIGQLNGREYAFIAFERMGGVMIYDITAVTKPRYVSYTWGRIAGGSAQEGTAGDHGPEGLIFIPAADSPNKEPLLAVANEVSGSNDHLQDHHRTVSRHRNRQPRTERNDSSRSHAGRVEIARHGLDLCLEGSRQVGGLDPDSWRSVQDSFTVCGRFWRLHGRTHRFGQRRQDQYGPIEDQTFALSVQRRGGSNGLPFARLGLFLFLGKRPDPFGRRGGLLQGSFL